MNNTSTYYGWVSLLGSPKLVSYVEFNLGQSDPLKHLNPSVVDAFLVENRLPKLDSINSKLIHAAACHFSGDYAQLLRHCNFKLEHVDSYFSSELLFFNILADHRLHSRATEHFEVLLQSETIQTYPGLHAKTMILLAGTLMNRCRFLEAKQQLPLPSSDQSVWDRYTLTQYHNVLFNCSLGLGDLEVARHSIEAIRPAPESAPVQVLAHLNRETALALERQDYDSATALVDQSLAFSSTEMSRVLLLEKKSRIFLRAGKIIAAKNSLSDVSQFLLDKQIDASYLEIESLNMQIELTQMTLKDSFGRAIQSNQGISQFCSDLYEVWIRQNVEANTNLGRFVEDGNTLARCCLLLDQKEKALRVSAKTLQVCREQNYGSLFLRSLWTSFVVNYEFGHFDVCLDCLAKINSMPYTRYLENINRLVGYMGQLIRSPNQFSQRIKQLRYASCFEFVVQLVYGVNHRFKVTSSVSGQSSSFEVGEHRLLSMLFSDQIPIVQEGCISLFDGNAVAQLDFRPTPLLESIFTWILKKPISFAEINTLRLGRVKRQLADADIHAINSNISRLRNMLRPFGFELMVKKSVLSLMSSSPYCVLEKFIPKKKLPRPVKRHQEIFQFILENQPASKRQLCQKFRISSQALHRYLQDMLFHNLIDCRGSSKATRYYTRL